MSPIRSEGSRSAALLREPTVHFVLLALLLFVVQRGIAAGGGDVVEVDPVAVQARVEAAEREAGHPLSPAERATLEETHIDEQILVREALALGLQEDPRIDDILVQKMLHVLSAEVIQPSDGELRAFYQANAGRYTPEATVTVDELVVPPGDGAALAPRIRAGEPPESFAGAAGVRHNALGRVSRRTLAAIFGPATAELVFAAEPDVWAGPHATVRGEHWFRVTERTEPGAPPLELVREQVRLDWIVEEEAARLDERVAALRSRYTVRYLEPGAP
jgi:hypothetical protein